MAVRLKTAANAAGRVVLFFMDVTFLFYEGPSSLGATPTSHNNSKPAIDGATKVVTPIRIMWIDSKFWGGVRGHKKM
jgi:hypothetical protein